MLKSKKFIVIALLATVVLAGSIGGVALAQTGDTTQTNPLMAKVAQILGIDQQQLEDAFAQARTEVGDEHLQALVDEGRITQEQADQFRTWMESRPDDLSGFGGGFGRHGGFGMHGGSFGMHGGSFGPGPGMFGASGYGAMHEWCEESATTNS